MYFLAINKYRNETSDGFRNTWKVYAFRSRTERDRILRDGLPLCGGGSTPYKTGVRLATVSERRQWHKDRLAGYEPPVFDETR